jgi:hypothetical protein
MSTKTPEKVSRKSSGNKTVSTPTNDDLLAGGGGSAPAAGVSFQAAVGAFFAVSGMAPCKVDERLELGAERILSFRFETEAPIDDILILTSGPGRLFFQAKTNLRFGEQPSSEMVKTVEQIVRQWKLCSAGDGSKGWNKPLDPDRDRFVIAVGPGTPDTVAAELSEALSLRREGSVPAGTSAKHKIALTKFGGLLKAAWQKFYSAEPTEYELGQILDLVVVARFDLKATDFELGAQILSTNLAAPDTARAAFMTLAGICGDRMRTHTGFDMHQIRRALERKGVEMLAPPSYRADQETLKKYSDRIYARLARFSELRIDEATSIPIPRTVAGAAIRAAGAGSLLVIGEPGAGKTGLIYNIAKALETPSLSLLILAVDDSGSINLQSEIGLEHPIRDLLEHWPGTAQGCLLIDGLDAARGGPAEAIYRRLITETVELPDGRWRVIATVRTLDLKAGQQLKRLFSGTPPDPNHREEGPDLDEVRHILVERWTEEEFELLLKSAPRLRAAVEAGGLKLRALAQIPFNTQLLADVLSIGVNEVELGSVRNQRQLLELYWRHRVLEGGMSLEACLSSVIKAMVEMRSLEINVDPIRREHATSLDTILRGGVLVTRTNERSLAFRHNILFDYAASRLYLNPFDQNQLHDLFLRDRGMGLILSPALRYALQELWDHEANRSAFWRQFVLLTKDKDSDPIARIQVARIGCEWVTSAKDIQQFLVQLRASPGARGIFSSVTIALSILLEDTPRLVSIPVWAYVVAELSGDEQFSGNIGFLVDRFLKLSLDQSSFEMLGAAARNLLERGLEP